MVQVIQPTYATDSLSRGLSEGRQNGNQLAQQLLPLLIQRGINQNIYGGSSGNPSATSPSPQTDQRAAPASFPQPASTQNQGYPSPARNSSQGGGLFDVLTNDEINAEKARVAQFGGDPIRREAELAAANERNQKNVKTLIDVAHDQGIGDARIPEILAYAKTRPDLKNPIDIVGAAKKEFDQISKADIPGFYSNLTKGPEARQKAIERFTPVAQALKNSGREQEGRTSFAENGLSQTEINYLFNPPSQQTKNAVKNLPDGIWKKKGYFDKVGQFLNSPIETTKERVSGPSSGTYERALEKHPKIIEKQNQQLENFFKDNVTPGTSLLVLRDQLWNKGYDWKQIADSFDRAFPDKNRLNTDQFSELTELHAAPLPSLSDLFSAGFTKRLNALTVGKR